MDKIFIGSKSEISYLIERDETFRNYEFYENAFGRDPGVIAKGVCLKVRVRVNENGKEIMDIPTLELEKVVLPDSLICFILNTFTIKEKEG